MFFSPLCVAYLTSRFCLFCTQCFWWAQVAIVSARGGVKRLVFVLLCFFNHGHACMQAHFSQQRFPGCA